MKKTTSNKHQSLRRVSDVLCEKMMRTQNEDATSDEDNGRGRANR